MCPPSSYTSDDFEDVGAVASAGGGAAAAGAEGIELLSLPSVDIDGASYSIQRRLEGRGQPGFAAFVKNESDQKEFLVKEDDLGTCFAEATADIIPDTMLPKEWRSVVNYASIAIKDNAPVTIQQKVIPRTSGNQIKGLDEIIFGYKRPPNTIFSLESWNNWSLWDNGKIIEALKKIKPEVKWQIAAALYASSLAGDESLHFGQFMAEVDGQGEITRIVRIDFGARERYSHIRNLSGDNNPICTSLAYSSSGQFYKQYITYFLQDPDIKSKYLALWQTKPDFDGISKKISERVTENLEKMSREQQINTITRFLEIINRGRNTNDCLRIENMDKDFTKLTPEELVKIHDDLKGIIINLVHARVYQMHGRALAMGNYVNVQDKTYLATLLPNKSILQLREELSQLQSELSAAQNQNSGLHAQVLQTQQSLDAERVNSQELQTRNNEVVCQLREELSQLQSALAVAQTQNTENQQRLAAEIENNKYAQAENRVTISQLQGDLSKAQSALAIATTNTAKVQQSLDAAMEKNSRIESQNVGLQSALAAAQTQNTENQQRLVAEIAKNKEAQAVNHEAISQLRSDLSKAQSALATATTNSAKVQQSLDAAMEKNSRIESQNTELQKEIDKLRKDGEAVNTQKDLRIAELERQLSEALSKSSKADDKEAQSPNKTEKQGDEPSQNNTAEDHPEEPSQDNNAYTNQLDYNLESNNNVNPVEVNIPEIQPQPVGLVSSVFEKINRFIKAVLQGLKDTVHSVARALKIR